MSQTTQFGGTQPGIDLHAAKEVLASTCNRSLQFISGVRRHMLMSKSRAPRTKVHQKKWKVFFLNSPSDVSMKASRFKYLFRAWLQHVEMHIHSSLCFFLARHSDIQICVHHFWHVCIYHLSATNKKKASPLHRWARQTGDGSQSVVVSARRLQECQVFSESFEVSTAAAFFNWLFRFL